MSRLSDIAARATLQQYAQGAAQQARSAIGEFIAPTVEVPLITGYYKKYTEKNRFRIPKTRRSLGGRATEIGFSAEDATYNCAPHALDCPIDQAEQDAAMENMLQEAAQMCAEAASLDHEKTVVDLAVATLGSPTDTTWDSTTDPVDELDQKIMTVIKACKFGSLMGVGVLFGASAWRLFKNHALVRAKYVVGTGKSAGVGLAVPTISGTGDLLIGNPEVNVSLLAYDTAAEGLAESIDWVFDQKVLVFARKANPTRRDPSFMKTFRLAGRWMVPGTYMRDDGRVEVAKMDWSEDVQVTNSAAAVYLNVKTS